MRHCTRRPWSTRLGCDSWASNRRKSGMAAGIFAAAAADTKRSSSSSNSDLSLRRGLKYQGRSNFVAKR